MSFIWYNESSYYIDLPRDFDIHINIYYIFISIVSISMLVPLISWYFRIKPTTFNPITITDGYLCIGSSGLGNTYVSKAGAVYWLGVQAAPIKYKRVTHDIV